MRIYERRTVEGLWKEKKIKELSFLRFGCNIPRKVFEKGPYRIKAMKIDIFTVSVIVHNKKKLGDLRMNLHDHLISIHLAISILTTVECWTSGGLSADFCTEVN